MNSIHLHSNPDTNTPLPSKGNIPGFPHIDEEVDDIINRYSPPRIERKPNYINEIPDSDDQDMVIH